jgi:hypothetical protein
MLACQALFLLKIGFGRSGALFCRQNTCEDGCYEAPPREIAPRPDLYDKMTTRLSGRSNLFLTASFQFPYKGFFLAMRPDDGK